MPGGLEKFCGVFTFDENSKAFCVGRDWQVVFVVKLRQQCVGGRRFCLIQCWEMGGDLILPPISCLCLFSGKLRSEQKVSESGEVLGSPGQHPRTMPRALLKLCSVPESQAEERVCIAMVRMSWKLGCEH